MRPPDNFGIAILALRSKQLPTPELKYYNMYKTKLETKSYLFMKIPRKIMCGFARFRMTCTNLRVEIGRHQNLKFEDRLCEVCGKRRNIFKIECEFHFLLECEEYDDLRNLYFGDTVSKEKNFI